MMTWKLLAETRRACLRVVLVGTALILLLIFAQTIGRILSGVEAQAWGWVFVVVLPVMLVLWASTLLNRYPAKIVHPNAHQSLVWGSFSYQLFALATLLAEPFAMREALSLVDYLALSLWWMLPMEVILLLGYWLVFYRKDLFFKPSEQVILDFAKQKAADWKGKGNLLRQQCFELLASNDLPGLFQKMKTEFEKSSQEDFKATLLLENQFNSVDRDRALNIVDFKEAQIILNRIVMGALNLVEKI